MNKGHMADAILLLAKKGKGADKGNDMADEESSESQSVKDDEEIGLESAMSDLAAALKEENWKDAAAAFKAAYEQC